MAFFATAFAARIRDGMQSEATLQGTIGSTTTSTRVLPEAEFRVGGLRTVLRPAELIDGPSLFGDARHHVWLGSDLLQQANQVTIDFRAMQLTMH